MRTTRRRGDCALLLAAAAVGAVASGGAGVNKGRTTCATGDNEVDATGSASEVRAHVRDRMVGDSQLSARSASKSACIPTESEGDAPPPGAPVAREGESSRREGCGCDGVARWVPMDRSVGAAADAADGDVVTPGATSLVLFERLCG